MSSLVIATPGVPLSTPKKGGTIEGISHAHSLGIRAMEMEWVQSVPKNPDHVAAIGELAASLDFTLTVHAPFFINLNSAEEEKITASRKRILDALSMAQIAGAVSVCVHAAFYGGNKDLALENVRRATDEILGHKQKLFPDVNLGYETMGKHSQFGTVEEVLAVSKEFDLYPVIDVSHLHARTNGGFNDADSWNALFDQYEEALGKNSLKTMHLHLSGIAYSDKGERNHLPLEESDTDWRGYLGILKERGVGGVLVCESPTLENDTMLLRDYFDSL